MSLKKIFVMFLVTLFTNSIFSQESIIERDNLIYLSNTVVIKLKDTYLNPSVVQQKINQSLKKKIIKEIKPAFDERSLKKGTASLNRIFILNLENGNDPLEVSKKISQMKEIEWAEPKFIRKVVATPNDSLFSTGSQTNLTQINALDAWDITKGDSSIIIGIVDTGVDWNHPDISANIYRDNDGNIVGYDFGGLNGTPDEDPSEDKAPFTSSLGYHGTHVAGIAAAVTNNSIGIASIGYNSSVMPVKASRNDKRDSKGEPYIYFGLEGIKYAAEHGAKVINCSWGGYGYSKYEQEIIDYVVSLGSLVVAAAGNENKNLPFYPASYSGVLSVGWLESDDKKATYSNSSGSNYGYSLDVFAPGTSIISTWPLISGEKYKRISGTSMASPHVAGLAALVFSRFPNYTPLQVAEKIRMTCDDIYTKNPDSLYFLLGRGKINAYKAVKDTNLVSVRAINFKFIDKPNENGLLEKGEQVFVNVTFQNYLDPASNINVELICNDPAIQIINSKLTITQLNTLETFTNNNNEFTFLINDNAPFNHTVNFMLKFTGNNYSDFQWFSVRINPTYDTHNSNKITMTITSKGTLGFNDYPDNTEGDGFKFDNGDNLLFEGAFMYGVSESKVMDAARENEKQSDDFNIIQQIKISDSNGSQIGTTVFDDSNFGVGRLGIETHLTSYSFIEPPNDKYIILLTELKNTTTQDINGLYAGYFFDWDMPAENPIIDTTAYDEVNNFGYAFCIDQTAVSTYVGAALISSNNYGFYPIDNSASTGDIQLFDSNGFTKKEKWISLSSGVVKTGAGPSDVSFTISGGPFNIPAGQSIPIAFVVAAGENLNDLRNSIQASREKYQSLITNIAEQEVLPKEFKLYQNYPNPFNPTTVINYQLPERNFVTLKVYDILGREITTLVNEYKDAGSYKVEFSVDKYNLSSGVYFYILKAGKNFLVKKMMLTK